ncbi:hypothetical protein K1719_009513 [Acacia pycnantha]|nr:hypothetical protein K1719_009513 [Acacia pycnantha]
MLVYPIHPRIQNSKFKISIQLLSQNLDPLMLLFDDGKKVRRRLFGWEMLSSYSGVLAMVDLATNLAEKQRCCCKDLDFRSFVFISGSWPSEHVLAYYCLSHAELFRHKKVIELGSGYGLSAFVIAAVTEASEVVISDGNPQVVNCILSSFFPLLAQFVILQNDNSKVLSSDDKLI